MEILIFIAVIIALIVVHEIGHFVAAKLSGMRVDEFGLGYPPRALILGKVGETIYTLNWLPFGGFVKIFGEDGTNGTGNVDPRSFSARPRILQAIVLVAGVAMNLLFAYVLITGALVVGTPRAISPEEMTKATDVNLVVSNVLPESPAFNAGIRAGDIIISAESENKILTGLAASEFVDFVSGSPANSKIALSIRHSDGRETVTYVSPVTGLVDYDPSRHLIGIEVANIGIIPISFFEAPVEGAVLTWEATKLIAVGLAHFFYGIFTMSADLSQVAGPVGIVGIVGSASAQGIGYLLSIMAVISINLALINMIPIPALDGGRLLFVIIEGIIRRQINPSIAGSINAIGFIFLILLMVVITTNDILRIIN